MNLEKIKALLSKDIAPSINLRKKYPDYFNMWIIRFGWFALLVLLISEYIFNGGFVAYHVYCDKPEGCLNPFFACAFANGTELPALKGYIDVKGFSISEESAINVVQQNPRDYDVCVQEPAFCADGMCSRLFLDYGDEYGRKGAGAMEVFAILLLTFVINHLWYILRGKKNENRNNF